jgi:hypothetical protein
MIRPTMRLYKLAANTGMFKIMDKPFDGFNPRPGLPDFLSAPASLEKC